MIWSARLTLFQFHEVLKHEFASVQVSAFPITAMFGMCAIFLAMAGVLQRRLFYISSKAGYGEWLPSTVAYVQFVHIFIGLCVKWFALQLLWSRPIRTECPKSRLRSVLEVLFFQFNVMQLGISKYSMPLRWLQKDVRSEEYN